jgi:hypothetical protein
VAALRILQGNFTYGVLPISYVGKAREAVLQRRKAVVRRFYLLLNKRKNMDSDY